MEQCTCPSTEKWIKDVVYRHNGMIYWKLALLLQELQPAHKFRYVGLLPFPNIPLAVLWFLNKWTFPIHLLSNPGICGCAYYMAEGNLQKYYKLMGLKERSIILDYLHGSQNLNIWALKNRIFSVKSESCYRKGLKALESERTQTATGRHMEE